MEVSAAKMRLLITLLMTFSVAESFSHKYWPWLDAIRQDKGARWSDRECLAKGSKGIGYRGTISVTHKGQTCLYWDDVPIHTFPTVHESRNYCRNPDNRAMPWCWIRRPGNKFGRQYCNIPQCEIKPDNSQAKPERQQQDTETTCGERNKEQKFNKIVGGLRSSAESHPWIASIFRGAGFSCGGTLIAPCWVLTAAHCFSSGKRTKLEQYSVYLGRNAINETDPSKEQKFKVTKLVIHEDYNHIAEDFNNDIALLQIEDSNGQCAHRTASVRTACLPPDQQLRPYGSVCYIAGYGREVSNSFYYSQYLKEAKVQLISPKVCQTEQYYGKRITKNMFCAGSQTWSDDACQGDSGGPLLCEVNGRMFLFGIISWGDGCASEFKPGVYTKVSNYNRWIAQRTGLPSFTKGIMYPQKD